MYALSGLYQIDQQERGVVFRFGAVKSDVVMPGLHWFPRFIDTVANGQRDACQFDQTPGADADEGRKHRRCDVDGAIRHR